MFSLIECKHTLSLKKLFDFKRISKTVFRIKKSQVFRSQLCFKVGNSPKKIQLKRDFFLKTTDHFVCPQMRETGIADD